MRNAHKSLIAQRIVEKLMQTCVPEKTLVDFTFIRLLFISKSDKFQTLIFIHTSKHKLLK
jgi:hypothetical protein